MSGLPAIEWIANRDARSREVLKVPVAFLDGAEVRRARAFHRSFPEYRVTPLHSLGELSRRLGVRNIWIKDESHRFGLNAFKVLGGAYAIGRYLAERLGVDIASLSFEKLRSPEVKARLGEITFVTATDGNHGRGVAWAARQLGQRAVVFMPKGSSVTRLERIRGEGAEASILDLNYDDAVRLAASYAAEQGGVLVQDSAWDGYEQIPSWIMQGYCTLVDEALEQIAASEDGAVPTHLFLQAGVGSFAASVLGHLVARFGQRRPTTIIVEPDEAACIYKSASINDGRPHAVTGDLPTIMAGLACGEPSTVAWPILREYADLYISCADSLSARGMRILGSPLPGDPQVISGESGAVGLGVLSLLAGSDLAEPFSIDKDSRVLIISTEGDTDPQRYREIVWDGAYPSA